MPQSSPRDAFLESSWARAIIASPLWLLRVLVGWWVHPREEAWVLLADACLVLSGLWIAVPLRAAQGSRFPDKTTLASLPMLAAVFATVMFVRDLWRLLS